MNSVYLGLGTNIGDRNKHLEEARKAIAQELGVISKSSSIIETLPWGVEDQAKYLNQVLCIQTRLAPLTLLQAIHQIEKNMGRVRHQKWEARIIDIDILFFNDEIIQEEHLQIPHPLMHQRQFVLEPLCEIAPTFVHSVFQKTIAQILVELKDA